MATLRTERHSVPAIVAALFFMCCGFGVATARAQDVDLLLVMAADVSRSIDEGKFKLQRDGYVSAITDPSVLSAIMTTGTKKRIGVIFLEWAGVGETKIVADWSSIGTEEEARKFAEQIAAAPRSFYGRTSIAGAIDEGVAQLHRSPFRSDRHIIDISGDGTNNAGREIFAARDAAVEGGITINGIVILSAVPLPFNPAHTHPPGGLLAYYEKNVIGGNGSFAMAAEGFETFGQALRSKLVKEIADAAGGKRSFAAMVPEAGAGR